MSQKRLLRPLILSIGLLILGVNLISYLWDQLRLTLAIGNIPAFDPWQPLAPPALTSFSRLFELLTVFILVALLLLARHKKREIQGSQRWWWIWLVGVVSILLTTAAINLVVNPRNLYGTQWFEPRLNNFLSQKLDDYDAFPETPDLLLIGSSHFLQIPADYISKTLGFRTFNFSIPGAIFPDLIPILNYQAAHNKLAPVLLVDMFPILPVTDDSAFIQAPIRLVPYGQSWQVLAYLAERLNPLVQSGQLAESLYSARHDAQDNPAAWFQINPDGGSANAVAISKSDFQNQLSQSIDTTNYNHTHDIYSICHAQNAQNLTGIDQLAKWAAQNQSSIVFVMSPYQPEYYAVDLAGHPASVACMEALQAHLVALAQQNSNIFFENRLDPTSFNAEPDYRGFLDGIHMNTFNSERFIDALASSLEAAMRVATQQRGISMPIPQRVPAEIIVSMDQTAVGWGWYGAEPIGGDHFFQWSGPENESTVEALVSTTRPLRAEFCVIAAANPQVLNSLRILANDIPLQIEQVQKTGCAFAYTALLPESILSREANRILFSFEVDQTIPASPADARLVGIALRDISLTPVASLTATIVFDESFSGGNLYAVEHDAEGNPYRWTGPEAETDVNVFKLDNTDVNISLCLNAAITENVLNSLQLEANQQVIPLTPASSSECRLLYVGRVPTTVAALRQDSIHFALRVDHTTAPNSLDPSNPDNRPLGIALCWLRIEFVSDPSA